jgi:RimJ/RimL family protein N-acetyltransferase
MADRSHPIQIDGPIIQTQRLTLRPWELDDVDAALEIFGADAVTRWLAPSVDRISERSAMREQLSTWMAPTDPPLGHWVVVDHENNQVVGSGQIIPLPPENRDLLIGYEIAPTHWGHGFGTEAGHALAHYAFDNGQDEVFAVVRTRNERAEATARKIGMEWVGETEKYFGLRLNVYRLRPGDLDRNPLETGLVP